MAAMMSTPCRCLSKNVLINLSTRNFSRNFKHQIRQYQSAVAGRVKKPYKLVRLEELNNRGCKFTSTSSAIGIRDFHSSLTCFESTTVKVPPFAESVSEGDVRWEKAVGDAVEQDEVVCEIETDKTAIPVNAPFAGVIEAALVEDGSTVTAGTALFKISSDGIPAASSVEAPKEASTPPPPEPTPAPPPSQAAGSIPTSPPTPPTAVPPPSEPISSTSVDSITPKPYKPPTPTISSTSSGPAPGSQITGSRSEQRVKMNRMRLRIAQRLKDAQNTNAMLTTFNEIDMSNITEMRNKFKDSFLKTHNIKLGFMSAFVKASAYALQDQPTVNAVIDGTEIVYRDYIDISVAVATPKGLVVPVIRNVEKMNFATIEKTINALGEKARAGSLAIEDMDGGTFTISNGGVFGSMFGTPIINPPQSAILGMHGIFQRPVAINGKVEIRPMMYVALTYDHRLIDGREATLFLRKIKESVEDPRVVLLDI